MTHTDNSSPTMLGVSYSTGLTAEEFKEAYVARAFLWGMLLEPRGAAGWCFIYKGIVRSTYNSHFTAAVEFVRLNKMEAQMHAALDAIGAGDLSRGLEAHLNGHRWPDEEWFES